MTLTKNRDHAAAPAKGVTLADHAANRLREDIVSGLLVPDSPLRIEELRRRYEIGASPLREALSRLVVEGLVCLQNMRGFSVAGFSREDLDDIAFMRAAIESQAIRKAIANGAEEWEAGIVATLHTFTRLTEKTDTDRQSLDAWQKAHDAFHAALIADCESPRALDFQRLLSLQHDRYRRSMMGENMPRELLITEHQTLAEAALDRDADRAADMLSAHFRLTSDFYSNALEEDSQTKS